MQLYFCSAAAATLVVMTSLHVCLNDLAAQSARRAPTRVNSDSIRSTSGQPLLRAFRAEESSEQYQGGFLHVYPNRNAARERQEAIYTAQLNRTQDPETDLLPPLPSAGGEGEEVMGIQDPSIDEPVFAQSPVILDGHPADGFMAAECGSCKTGKCKGGCGKGHHGAFADWNWACICVPLPPMDNLSVNFGAHGFKDQASLGLDDSFGFHAGANLGAAFGIGQMGLGWQIGLQGVTSNYSGAGDNIIGNVEGSRDQLFFTWGFFRRVDCGLQGGLVFDHLRDDWYYDEISVSQLRGELSLMHDCYHEFGLFFYGNTRDENVDIQTQNPQGLQTVNVRTADLFALFYRHHFDDCGYSNLRAYIGLTGNREFFDSNTEESSVVLGGDIHLGMSECWALETGFTYVTAADEDNASQQEDWNVAFNLIWYPYGQQANTLRRYYRPLFNVADNGSMLLTVDN